MRSPLSLAERQAIFLEARRLKISHPSVEPEELRDLLSRRFPRLPSKITIDRWLGGKTAPMTSTIMFEASPSEELSFFLGAWLGDGWSDESDGGKRLLLKVRTREFAEEFATSATTILKKKEPYLARRILEENGTWYQVKVTSVLLYELVNRPFAELIRFIDSHPRGFLRGFFTAEGNPSVSISGDSGGQALDVTVCVSNTEISYLECAMKMMKRLGYHPTKITRGGKPGVERTIGTHNFVTATTEWQFRIARIAEVESFLAQIGFADVSKQEKAATAVRLIKRLGARSASSEWPKLYSKVGRKWVRKTGS